MAGIFGNISKLFGSGGDIYGRRPNVPEGIDYTDELQDALKTNQDLLPGLSAFAKLSTEEMANVLEVAFPGYKNIRSNAGESIASMIRGEVPTDVQNQLERQAAQRGVTLGYGGGSGFGQNQYLRNFGLTSLQLNQQGLDTATRWIQQAQNLTFDFSKMLLNKDDAMRRSEFNWQRDWLAAQVAASPDPRKRGPMDTDLAVTGMILGMYGGPGYQGAYKPTYTNTTPNGTGGDRDSFFGGGGAPYGSTYEGAGGNTYVSVGTDTPGGGMSVPMYNPSPGGSGYSDDFYNFGPQ